MAILKSDVSAGTVRDLLSSNLRIPPYQRPYSWEPEMALRLLDDIQEAMIVHECGDVAYVLGAVILHKTDSHLDIVDGQQRLLTLRMILRLLEGTADTENLDRANNHIGSVWAALQEHIGSLKEEKRDEIRNFILDRCELVRVVTDDIDEAFRVFDSQNYRGRPLAPHDILKAYHLREMRDETIALKAAVVESWESVNDTELDRLFSTFLYRIFRWSRGESASQFGVRDIGIFKGISLKSSRSPSSRYHIAAQVAIPVLSAWDKTVPARGDRNTSRSQFQLDAPLVAGQAFFGMVSFMLSELKFLAREGFTEEREMFSFYFISEDDSDGLLERPSRSRYRYVSELYLAALLYYTNKFGGEDLTSACNRLFAWAYAPRVELLRVQFRTIDNHARGNGDFPKFSAFGLMRNAESCRVVRQLTGRGKPRNDDHEKELMALLNKLKTL